MSASLAIEVVDETMDDTEIDVQNDMFARIMDVCGGHPNRRVLEVLADALTCVAVNTGEPLNELIERIEIAYNGASPKAGRDN